MGFYHYAPLVWTKLKVSSGIWHKIPLKYLPHLSFKNQSSAGRQAKIPRDQWNCSQRDILLLFHKQRERIKEAWLRRFLNPFDLF